MHKVVISTLFFSVISACSRSNLVKEDTDFLTRITPSGLKHFELRVRVNEPDKRALLGHQRPRGEQNPRTRINPKKIKKALRQAAEAHIDDNGFCSTGFWVVDSDAYAPNRRIRGECNEVASEGDILRFPDTIKVW